jgi:nickel transport protein
MDEKVGETQILSDGLFRFTPKESTSYRFFINLGAGHVVSVIMKQDELPENFKTQEDVASVSVVTPQVSTNTATSSTASEISQLVAKAVRKEIQPLRKEIASYKEKNDLQSILGGIGYILGLSGIAFYMAARRKEGQNA